ncbi:uracil permease [Cutibacterium acnes JCM 18918]|nr:uracil permease [Cutibacterium acnes JCM 18918]
MGPHHWLGAQHVVAMFGATFVFPVLMGLNPQLAVMMSGVATLVFIFVTQHEVPSYLGSSAAFPGVATAIYASGGKPNDVSGALLCVGLTLLICGIIIQAAGSRVVHKVLPPTVTGAVVMLIGFNLAPVVAKTYWPTDQWTALIVMLLVIALSVGRVASCPGSLSSWLWLSAICCRGPKISYLARCTTPMAAPPREWTGRRYTTPRGSAYLRRRT